MRSYCEVNKTVNTGNINLACYCCMKRAHQAWGKLKHKQQQLLVCGFVAGSVLIFSAIDHNLIHSLNISGVWGFDSLSVNLTIATNKNGWVGVAPTNIVYVYM